LLIIKYFFTQTLKPALQLMLSFITDSLISYKIIAKASGFVDFIPHLFICYLALHKE